MPTAGQEKKKQKNTSLWHEGLILGLTAVVTSGRQTDLCKQRVFATVLTCGLQVNRTVQ